MRWSRTQVAHRTSNWLAFGALPLGAVAALFALGTDRDTSDPKAADRLAIDVMFVGQAVAISALVNQAVKFAVGRERPFVQALEQNAKAHTRHPADNNLSFYSGHTSLAFSLVAATAMTAHLRAYRSAGYVWAVGVPLAALAGYLRIAADRHYLSDVCVGAVLGAGIGALTPWLSQRIRGNTR